MNFIDYMNTLSYNLWGSCFFRLQQLWKLIKTF